MEKQAIDALLGAAVTAGHVPGLVALAADRDGPVYQGAFGRRRVGEPAPMTPDTVLWLASMTKAITAVAALQMVAAGRLSLHGPISDVLPELAEMQVLEGHDADGAPILRPARGAITLHHLLTQTSGFGYNFWSADLGRYMKARRIPSTGSGRVGSLHLPLLFDPGARWEYGISTDHVGRAVERARGQRLGDYFREHVTLPLGMHDTAFRITPSMRDRLAPIHTRGEDGALVATDIEVVQSPEFESGGGGLYGTLPDYLRFLRMLLGGGALDGVRILPPELTASALREQIAPLSLTPMRSAMPGTTGDAEFFPGLRKGWSLLGMVNVAPAPTGRSPDGNAWAGLANTFWWLDPKRGLCAVLGTQLFPFADPPVIALLEGYERALLN